MKISYTARDSAHWERMNKLRDSYQCRGRIKAEGKKAKPVLCFRARSEGKGSAKTTVLELHSKVTGKQIGFFGGDPTRRLVKEKAQARTWDYLNGSFAQSEFRSFLHDAKGSGNTWNKVAKDALKEMIREAKAAGKK